FADGALIDAGGDIGVFGDTRDGGPWHVALAAAPPDRRCIAQLRGGGIATSSVLRRAWTHNDKTAHHLIDPLTGEPASSDVLEATVWARNTLLAEVAAKALVLRGAAFAPRIRSWLPESVCAWTTTTGEFRADSAFREEVLACAV
ncbi:MAG TPA: FAD:protein FMN transferase, partial [Dehalococcoidia bacterium]|nr:FAD:protein FMN transferase [Dehalococcoidia bacterium]